MYKKGGENEKGKKNDIVLKSTSSSSILKLLI